MSSFETIATIKSRTGESCLSRGRTGCRRRRTCSCLSRGGVPEHPAVSDVGEPVQPRAEAANPPGAPSTRALPRRNVARGRAATSLTETQLPAPARTAGERRLPQVKTPGRGTHFTLGGVPPSSSVYLAHKKAPRSPLAPPLEPRHSPTVGSCGVAVSFDKRIRILCS